MQKFNKHFIIVGSARSGTSWLTEIIATQFRYRLLFEPEHEFNTTDGHLICDQFFDGTIPTNAETYLTRVFKNKVDNDWIAQCSDRRYKMHLWPLLPKKYIIKFVRANLAAVAINANFHIPVVHIIRNPYEVLYSQQRVKFPWLYDLEHFKVQKALVQLLKTTYNFDLISTDTYSDLERLTIRWCIENVIPIHLKPATNNSYKVIKYEDLYKDINVFYELCDTFDLEPLKNIEEVYKKPSSKTHPKSSIRNQMNQKMRFTDDDYKCINALLKVFKVDFYDYIISDFPIEGNMYE